MSEDEEATTGSSQTHVFSPSRSERTEYWPRPPRRYRGGRAIVKRKIDGQLGALMERIWLELESKGIVPDYGRWTNR